jgi:hypothetical protein
VLFQRGVFSEVEMQQQISSTLQIFLAQFKGQVLIPFAVAVLAVGIAPQTARNQLVAGKFPIQTVVIGARRFIHVEDLANFVESLRQPKRGRAAA